MKCIKTIINTIILTVGYPPRLKRHKMSRTVQVNLEDLQPGHQIVWNRNPYYHHAIIANVNPKDKTGYIVHFYGRLRCSTVESRVSLEKVNFNNQIGTLGKVNYISCDIPELVMARAYSLVLEHNTVDEEDFGIGTCCMRLWCHCCGASENCHCKTKRFTCNWHGFNAFGRNCQHFASWSKTGEWKSAQVITFGRIGCYRASSFYWHYVLWGIIRVLTLFFSNIGDHTSVYIEPIGGYVDILTVTISIALELLALLYLAIGYCCQCYGLYQKEKKYLKVHEDEYPYVVDIVLDKSRGWCDNWSCLCREQYYNNSTRKEYCGVDCCRAQDCTTISVYLRRFVFLTGSIICFHLLVNAIGYSRHKKFWSDPDHDSHRFLFTSIGYVIAILVGEFGLLLSGFIWSYCIIPLMQCRPCVCFGNTLNLSESFSIRPNGTSYPTTSFNHSNHNHHSNPERYHHQNGSAGNHNNRNSYPHKKIEYSEDPDSPDFVIPIVYSNNNEMVRDDTWNTEITDIGEDTHF